MCPSTKLLRLSETRICSSGRTIFEIVPGSMDIVVAELDGERALRFQMITA